MDQKLTYHVFVLCKKTLQKTPKRGKTTIFPKVSKMEIFSQMSNEEPGKIFKNGQFFGRTSEG